MQELKDQEAHFVAAMKEILKPQGRAIFDAIGATNVDELYSALVAFPSLAGTDGFDFPHVTTIAHSVSGKVLANFMEENAQFVHSSNQISAWAQPSDSQWSINVQVPLPVSSEVASPTEQKLSRLATRLTMTRERSQRGTCVPVAALRRVCAKSRSSSHLYLNNWAQVKYCTNNTDGTRIPRRHCLENGWNMHMCHYNPAPGP